MRIEDYFRITDAIADKQKDINALKKQLDDVRKEIDLDLANELRIQCDSLVYGEKKKNSLQRMRTESFVYLFVLVFQSSCCGMMPHRSRFLLSLILKKQGTAISRIYASAVKRVKTDEGYRNLLNQILEGCR